MAYDVDQLKRDVLVSGVAARLTTLVKDGREHRGLCPFHTEKTPSFTVNDERGFFHCFGCGAHGDVIDLACDAFNVPFREACELLGGDKLPDGVLTRPAEKAATPSLYANLKPLPIDDVPRPDEKLRVWNPKRDRWVTYRPSMVFPYANDTGAIVGVVLRIDLEAGHKITPTIRRASWKGGTGWTHMPFDKPRPLYMLDELVSVSADKQVFVVEGEKAANAFARMMEAPVTTWPGGTGGIAHVDWAPLKGRSVVLWPDADEPGVAAMLDVAMRARGVGAAKIKIIAWDKTKPKGWDAADAEGDGWTRDKTLSWMRDRISVWQVAAGQAPPRNEIGQHPSTPSDPASVPARDDVLDLDAVTHLPKDHEQPREGLADNGASQALPSHSQPEDDDHDEAQVEAVRTHTEIEPASGDESRSEADGAVQVEADQTHGHDDGVADDGREGDARKHSTRGKRSARRGRTLDGDSATDAEAGAGHEPGRGDLRGHRGGEQDTAEHGHHHFRVLGHSQGRHYYFPRGSRQIVSLTAPNHTAAALLELAPLAYWKTNFAGKEGSSKFDAGYAANALIETSHARGIFAPDRIRGRGAWLDEQRPVMHLGPVVYLGDVEHDPYTVPSRYIYEQAEPLELERTAPATNEEAHHLVDICGRFTWANKISGQLLAGWCVIAPVCGALRWRPHIWVTGSAGSGKTTAIDLVTRVVGPIAERVEGGTTEAGVRQKLFHDARPVIVDEAESEGKASAEVVQRMLQLARIASSGGMVMKGSPTGAAVAHTVRACFCFSSINVGVAQYADETRISRLVLTRNEARDRETTYAAMLRDIEGWFDEGYAARMFARTVKHLPTLLKNVSTFTNAAAAVLQNRRAADQLGALIAGLYLCHSTGEISFERALAWVQERPWTEHAVVEAGDEERRMLAKLLLERRTMDLSNGSKGTFTLGQVIEAYAYNNTISLGLADKVAERELAGIGIKVDIIDRHIVFSNTSPALKQILRETPWANNYKDRLEALPGAQKRTNTYFTPGLSSRATIVPLDVIEGGSAGDGATDGPN